MNDEQDKKSTNSPVDKGSAIVVAVLAIITFISGVANGGSARHDIGLALVSCAVLGGAYILVRALTARFRQSKRATGVLIFVSIPLALFGGVFLLLPRSTPASASNTSSPSPVDTTSTPSGLGLAETVGVEASTWANYKNASGVSGPAIHKGQTVRVTCRVKGLASGHGNSWWYQIETSPWDNKYYSPADSFYNNGQTTGDLAKTPVVDPAVSVC